MERAQCKEGLPLWDLFAGEEEKLIIVKNFFKNDYKVLQAQTFIKVFKVIGLEG